jgi:hypothetical protein
VHLRLAGSQVDPGVILRERDRPEEPILRDAWVVVVDLVAKVRGDRPYKEVNSDEPEGTLVLLPVLADVLAVHDPHVSNPEGCSPPMIAATPDVVNVSRARCEICTGRYIVSRSWCSIFASAVPNTACAAIMTPCRWFESSSAEG